MDALDSPKWTWLLPLTLIFVHCAGDPEIHFEHRHTLSSEEDWFWLEFDGDHGRLIVSDYETVRILRNTGTELVEEARFTADETSGGVAIDGDRAAALVIRQRARIYERRNNTWQVAATFSTEGCGTTSVGDIALAGDTLVLHTYDAICIAERADGWQMKRLATTSFNTADPVIRGNTIAFSEFRSNRVTIYKRDASGWHPTTIEVDEPHAIALSDDGVLAIDLDQHVALYDITNKPRPLASLSPQTAEPGEHFGAELEIDGNTLSVWSDDGVHLYRRRNNEWAAAGILHSHLPNTDWFGSRLVLDGKWLWVGDPDMNDDRFPNVGYIHGYERR